MIHCLAFSSGQSKFGVLQSPCQYFVPHSPFYPVHPLVQKKQKYFCDISKQIIAFVCLAKGVKRPQSWRAKTFALLLILYLLKPVLISMLMRQSPWHYEVFGPSRIEEMPCCCGVKSTTTECVKPKLLCLWQIFLCPWQILPNCVSSASLSDRPQRPALSGWGKANSRFIDTDLCFGTISRFLLLFQMIYSMKLTSVFAIKKKEEKKEKASGILSPRNFLICLFWPSLLQFLLVFTLLVQDKSQYI